MDKDTILLLVGEQTFQYRRAGLYRVEAKQEETKYKVLKFIKKHLANYGYPPSLQEICSNCGISSKSSAHRILRKLAEEGHIVVFPKGARAIKLLKPIYGIPLIGKIPAGEPLATIEESTDEYVPVDPSFFGGGKLVAVRIRGDSMVDAGILPGDIAIIRLTDNVKNGDIVAAVIYEPEPHVTLKKLKIEDGGIYLIPENPIYSPMFFSKEEVENEEIKIIGLLVGILRQYQRGFTT